MLDQATAPALEQCAPDPVRESSALEREERDRGGTHQRLAVVPSAEREASGARRVSLTRISWSAATDLDLAEWIAQGQRIAVMGQSAGWWVGDWLRFGNAKYGEKYSRATKITGYDAQTLMNMVWVATRFEASRRREKLSWSHHVEVAALDLLSQERVLNRAEGERLSVRDLRELLRAERRAKRDEDPESEPPEGASLVCPNCGYSFEEH